MIDEETILDRARKEPWNYGGALLSMYDALAAQLAEAELKAGIYMDERNALTARLAKIEMRAAIFDQYSDCGHGMIYQFDGGPCLACDRDALAAQLAAAEREREAMRELLREALDGEVEDVAAWNRRTRAALERTP